MPNGSGQGDPGAIAHSADHKANEALATANYVKGFLHSLNHRILVLESAVPQLQTAIADLSTHLDAFNQRLGLAEDQLADLKKKVTK